jgi:hypothetical protein
MGVISKKRASRFRKARRQLGQLRRQAAADFAQVPKDVKSVEVLVLSGHDPLHAVYVAFPEFDPYCQIVGAARDEYLPSRPSLSPLTMSYFTTWAFFDVRFGPDGETLDTCLLDVADLLAMDSFLAETIRQLQGSRMGIYEQGGTEGGRCRLGELVTDDEFACHVASGYRGKPGQLWYVRLCPPLRELFAAKHPLVNLDPRLLDAPAGPAIHPGVRIDGRELADVGRVVGQVQAGAEADLQNVAAGLGEQITSIPGHELPIQPEIAEQRGDHL